jgi:hypothetical protein
MQNPGTNVTQGNVCFANDANNPLNTGYPFANALLGVYDTYTQANKQVYGEFIYWNIEPHVQDTWKVTHNFHAGLRKVRIS